MNRKITGSVRVSSDEQKKKGQMVNVYKQDLIKHGVKEDNIVMELGYSGSIDDNDLEFRFDVRRGKFIIELPLKKKRPVLWNWLYNEVHRGNVKKHLVTKWDRLSRDIGLAIYLKKYCKIKGCEITATQDTNDERVMPILIVLAEDEAKQTKRRISSGKQFKFDNGLYLGTERLYGYKKTKLEIDGRKYLHLIPNPEEKQMIEDVFSNMDYKKVCRIHHIKPSTYYNIRRNRFYCGYISYKNEEKIGVHEPLITKERWKKYQ